MKNITKENFKYCIMESNGKGCLCAAMFHLYKDQDWLQLKFESTTDRYSEKTRSAWKVPFAGVKPMEGFYDVHKETINFLDKFYPNSEWWIPGQIFDDTNRTVMIKDLPNRDAPSGETENFWKQQYDITEKMFRKGYLNGNYPQGHYTMNGKQLVLLVSYFGSYSGKYLKENFISGLQACHKVSETNLKKNWLISNIVRTNSMHHILADDFWRLSLASQLYNYSEYKDNYIKSFLTLLGKSNVQIYNDYIEASLQKKFKDFEVAYDDVKAI